MAQRIQLRRGTAAEWTSANPVLANGEPGVEKDTGKIKFGDGVTAWASLPYASKGDQGIPGVADDTSVEALIKNPASKVATALTATYVPRWKANTAYAKGDLALSPNGDVVSALAAFTSGATYDATKWGLSAAYARRVDLVSKLPRPFFISHMGGELLYPENSIESERASARAGFPLDVDVRPLADGMTLAVSHDLPIARTMTGGTGNVSDYDAAGWKRLRIKPVIEGGAYGTPALLSEILDEFGGKSLIQIEFKSGDVPSTLAALDDIVARGLQKAVIAQSFTYWQVQNAAIKGITCMYLGADQTPAQLVADKIDMIGVDLNASNATVAAYKAAGLTVVRYTVIDRAKVLSDLALGTVDGFISSDPWQSSGQLTPKTVETFDSGNLWPTATKMLNINNKISLDPLRKGVRVDYNVSDTTPQGIRLGQFGVGPVKATARFKIRFLGPAADQNRYCHFFIGSMPNNQPYALQGDTSIQAYFATIRRNGTFALNKRVTGSATETNLATNTGTVDYAAAGTEGLDIEFELAITDTGVTLKDITRGVTLTSTDTSYRGTDAIISWTAMNTSAVLSDVRVVR